MNDQQLTAYGAFVLRITLGVMFLAHAAQKIFVFTVPGTVGFFASLGLPAIVAYFTIAAETLGGVALLLGFRTRIVASVLVLVLAGATWAHLGNGWSFTSPKGGWEYPLFLTLSALAQALLGAGHFAFGRSPR
ncbi:MAG: doxX-like family protein [Proteobacteria bacterium]|nr:doxX-like family protein [Pseudomonadota bacterium]